MTDKSKKEVTENSVEWFLHPMPMQYGERIDYHLCICGNHYGEEGFNRCDLNGERIPLSLNDEENKYGLCERCGCIIDAKKWLVVGKLWNFKKRGF